MRCKNVTFAFSGASLPGFLVLLLSRKLVYMCVHVCVCVCVCLPSRLLLTSGVIWAPYDCLNKFHSFCVAAVVDILGLSIDLHCRNQPIANKSKPLIHINSHIKQLFKHNKMEHLSYEREFGVRGCTCMEALKRRVGLGYR